MDIKQPDLSKVDPVNARWFQDAYRALKTPNFAVTKSTNQGYGTGAWSDLTFNTVVHNNLNLYDTVNHRVSPQGVPGMYFLNAHINLYYSTGTPTASTPLVLAIRTPSGVVRASSVYEIITGVGYVTIGTVFSLSVSCLDYLSGLRGTAEDDYRILSLYNGSGATVRIVGADGLGADTFYTPRFQGFKIPF